MSNYHSGGNEVISNEKVTSETSLANASFKDGTFSKKHFNKVFFNGNSFIFGLGEKHAKSTVPEQKHL